MGISGATIRKIRNIAITAVLKAENIQFKKVGREAITKCPWHNDTNPSLTINDEKNLCFCFACGGGTDSIAFIQQVFGLSFSEAISRIADKQNIIVEYDNIDPEEARRVANERHRSLQVLKDQHTGFRSGIRSVSGLKAREWLISRDIRAETSKQFELGYTETGFFANRITIPIHDHRGNLVGFTGRDISCVDGSVKYKNSASSDIFDKKSLLFNEHRILDSARMNSRVIFVEGHFDVINMWQCGIKNVVASQGSSGPALESIKRLARYCKDFVLCFDADKGGLKAVEAFLSVASDLSLNGEINILVAELPAGMDPDDCIRSGIDLSTIIDNAKQWIEWRIDKLTENLNYSDTSKFAQIEETIRVLIAGIKSVALKQYYIDKATKILCQSTKNANRLAKEWLGTVPRTRASAQWVRPSRQWTNHQVERRILRLYLHCPETRESIHPLMSKLKSKDHVWLWSRIKELMDITKTVDIEMVRAVVAVAEPGYVRSVRSILMPTIQLQVNDGILEHAKSLILEESHNV